MIREADTVLSATNACIGLAVAQTPVAGADESGLRVVGKLGRLHRAVTDALTWMGFHARHLRELTFVHGVCGQPWA
jgi:hypothetical protein